MADLYLAFDPSSSMSKGIYSLDLGKPTKWITMETYVVEVSASTLAYLQANRISSSKPEDEAWVKIGNQHYAVGYLAQSQLFGIERLREVKYEQAVPKVLAMLGAIAVREKLPAKFSLGLGILLPYGEWIDRERLRTLVEKSLNKFEFRGKEFKVSLEDFDCMPEGAGVFFRGSNFTKNPHNGRVLVVIIGHRNASYLLVERMQLKEGQTTPLGFTHLLNIVQRSTSSLEISDLVVPVYRAGNKVVQAPLKPLLRSQDRSLRTTELKEIVKAVKAARQSHWDSLAQWLSSRQFSDLEQVLITGGTSLYYRPELEEFFADSTLNWAQGLEDNLRSRWGKEITDEFPYRLTDIYGYFFYFSGKLLQGDRKSA